MIEAGGGKRVEEMNEMITVTTLSPSLQHTHTHLSVFVFGPLCSSGVESVQLGQDQSQVIPQGVAVSLQFHLLSGPLVLFAVDHSDSSETL